MIFLITCIVYNTIQSVMMHMSFESELSNWIELNWIEMKKMNLKLKCSLVLCVTRAVKQWYV
jgi:hypothetical protein